MTIAPVSVLLAGPLQFVKSTPYAISSSRSCPPRSLFASNAAFHSETVAAASAR